ncbi:lipase 3 [Condylostylus longicornis]|uniref:lipase 3 n=1 Tax=Condylostylus longicornis TaxID=2530218 RepID=UPI00244E5A16|nr:lipase 3 [Condylostylus longicornis]
MKTIWKIRKNLKTKTHISILITLTIISLFFNTNTVLGFDLVCQIIQTNGYPCEIYQVNTEDGYILSLYRIPPKKMNSIPFVLMHGIIGSSADFALLGKKRSLGSILHDNDYDVWLPSARGTTYSKRHRSLESNDNKFWDFSWHEIGYYDLAAVIDFILEKTNQTKVHYVGHSQGSTVCMVLLTEKPEYNDKIATASFLAPVAYLSHLLSPPLRILATKMSDIEQLTRRLNLYEILPTSALNQLGGHLFCAPGLATQSLCILSTYLVVGFSDYELDRNVLPKILETTPAGISAKQLLHFGQAIYSGKFQQYDYGSKQKNFNHYQQKTPPEYNLKNIRIPLYLFYGTKDYIMVKQDVMILASQLKNAKVSVIELRGFNHIDLLYSTEAYRFIYKRILANTKNYLQNNKIIS